MRRGGPVALVPGGQGHREHRHDGPEDPDADRQTSLVTDPGRHRRGCRLPGAANLLEPCPAQRWRNARTSGLWRRPLKAIDTAGIAGRDVGCQEQPTYSSLALRSAGGTHAHRGYGAGRSRQSTQPASRDGMLAARSSQPTRQCIRHSDSTRPAVPGRTLSPDPSPARGEGYDVAVGRLLLAANIPAQGCPAAPASPGPDSRRRVY